MRGVLCLLFGVCVAATAHAEEFTYPLFDGVSLAGWTIENECEVEILPDGVLLLKSGNGWLRSHHQYRDVKLHVEWRALQTEKYDAGVFFRAAAEGAPFPKPAYQVNMLQGQEGTLIGVPAGKCTGLANPPGEWNTFDLAVIGETVALNVNGKKAYSAQGVEVRTGYIGFQIEVPLGGQFELRNIRVTEPEALSMFDGRELTGWEGAEQPAASCWSVENGAIVCDGSKGPWLRYRKPVADFNLRFDYQLEPGGNSGIYVRVPSNGAHHRDNDTQPPAGFEVQVLDDADPKYAKLKDYQYSASVYDIQGADPRVCRPAGEWNTLEINCDGQSVTTVHNGVVVVRINAETHPLLALRSVEGYLGLQNHTSVVRFRHLRLSPPREIP